MIKKKENIQLVIRFPPLFSNTSSPLYLYLSLPSADIFFNNIEKKM